MKPFRKIALALVLSCLALVAGNAQNPAYIWLSFDLGENASSDGIIRETRAGDKLTAAEIDFCFQREFQGKWDRIVLPLKIDGDRISGTGTSSLGKIPVAIDLTKTRTKDTFAYGGTVSIAGQITKVEQDNLTFRSLEDLNDTREAVTLEENPADFTAVSPQTVAVRFQLGELKNVLAALRGEAIVLDTNYGLIENCNALRTRQQTIQFTTAPENAPALVAKLRKLKGVLAAGWTGYVALDQAIRVSSANWTANGKPDRDKLAQKLAAVVAPVLGGKLVSTRWEKATGQLVVELTRPSVRFQDAGFSEAVTVRLLLAPERLSSSEYFVISVVSVTANLLDEGAGPRLDIPPFPEVGGEGYVATDKIVAALAKDLHGAVWDSGPEKWGAAQ